MNSVAIIGVGLIGGSCGLALRKAGFRGEILGVSSPGSISEALAVGAIDRAVALDEAVNTCDVLFLSQPISGILDTLRKLGPLVRPNTLVTDAGSTKQAIVAEAARSLKRCTFLGGHPMAGKEQRGAGAAEAELFRGRPWIFTSDIEHPFRQWVAKFGAREIVLDAATHDRLVAWSSHLPQLASTALASVLSDQAPDAATVAGPGLVDSTRLAMSAYDLWRDIIDTNRPEILRALDAYIERLKYLRNNFESEFEKASAFAKTLRQR